jgi:hypothetical protein
MRISQGTRRSYPPRCVDYRRLRLRGVGVAAVRCRRQPDLSGFAAIDALLVGHQTAHQERLVAPEGWPENSPMWSSTLDSWRVVGRCERHLAPKYRELVAPASSSQRVFHLRSARQIGRSRRDREERIFALGAACQGERAYGDCVAFHSMESPAAIMMPSMTNRKMSALSRSRKGFAMKAPAINDDPAIRPFNATSRSSAPNR